MQALRASSRWTMRAHLATGTASPGYTGRGGFWLWPPVSPDRTSLRVTVSIMWEAAWADVDLPR